jgi:hypothetical protein
MRFMVRNLTRTRRTFDRAVGGFLPSQGPYCNMRTAVDLRDVGRLDRGRVESGDFEGDVQARHATATNVYDLSRSDLIPTSRGQHARRRSLYHHPPPFVGPALVPAYPFSAARSEDWKMGASLRQSSPSKPTQGSSSAKSYPIEPCHRTDPATLTRSPRVSSPPYMHWPC